MTCFVVASAKGKRNCLCCGIISGSPKNKGASKLGLSRRMNHAERDTLFIKSLTANYMASRGSDV